MPGMFGAAYPELIGNENGSKAWSSGTFSDTKQNNNLPLKMCNVGQLHCVIDGFPITESISIDEMAIPHLRTNADSLSGAVVERIQLSRIATQVCLAPVMTIFMG